MNAKISVVIFHSSTNVQSGMTHPVVHVERWYRMEMSRIIITLSYHLLQTNQMAEKTKVRVGMDAETTDRSKAKPFFLQTKGIRFRRWVPAALIVVIDRYHSGHLSAFSLAFVISYEAEVV